MSFPVGMKGVWKNSRIDMAPEVPRTVLIDKPKPFLPLGLI